jgi:hypothetical protein
MLQSIKLLFKFTLCCIMFFFNVSYWLLYRQINATGRFSRKDKKAKPQVLIDPKFKISFKHLNFAYVSERIVRDIFSLFVIISK